MEYQSNQPTNKTFLTMVTLRPILDLHVVQPHLGICPIHLGIALTEGKNKFSQKSICHLVSNLRAHQLLRCIPILCATERETVLPIKLWYCVLSHQT